MRIILFDLVIVAQWALDCLLWCLSIMLHMNLLHTLFLYHGCDFMLMNTESYMVMLLWQLPTAILTWKSIFLSMTASDHHPCNLCRLILIYYLFDLASQNISTCLYHLILTVAIFNFVTGSCSKGLLNS